MVPYHRPKLVYCVLKRSLRCDVPPRTFWCVHVRRVDVVVILDIRILAVGTQNHSCGIVGYDIRIAINVRSVSARLYRPSIIVPTQLSLMLSSTELFELLVNVFFIDGRLDKRNNRRVLAWW